MRGIVHKTLPAATALLLLLSSLARAEAEAVVNFDLTLAGYRIGMSVDEAAAIRPFHYQQPFTTSLATEHNTHFDAFVDHVYLEDIALKLWIHFKNDRIQKVVARFAPDRLADVTRIFHQALGPGEDKSRVHVSDAGKESRQTIYLWDFPAAKMHLIALSDNDSHATAGLVAKSVAEDLTIDNK